MLRTERQPNADGSATGLPGEARRTLVVEWDDPASTAQAASTMSGLDFLRSLLDGALPGSPVAALMGLTGLEVEKGRVLFRGEPGEQHLNPVGAVHGGFAATLLDSALGCSVHTTLPAGLRFTTIDLALTYVRAISSSTGPVLCEATVTHSGRTIATANGRLTRQTDGKLLAHGSTTCLVQKTPSEPNSERNTHAPRPRDIRS